MLLIIVVECIEAIICITLNAKKHFFNLIIHTRKNDRELLLPSTYIKANLEETADAVERIWEERYKHLKDEEQP